MKKRVAIVGAGAAGMMAAARIQEVDSNIEIVVFEKNPVMGKKVTISGGGRCNVTTGIHDVRELLKRYERGSKFLTNAMWNFPPEAVYEWFEGHGVPLKTEDDMRVFPQSNDGTDIVGVFDRLFSDESIEVRLQTSVDSVTKESDQFIVHSTTKGSDQLREEFDAVVFATGGQAYRHTGSTGDGYTFAESVGHTVTPLAASLNAFVLQQEWTHQLPGVSFEHIQMNSGEHTVDGPIVFTHRGISGPAVFALSAKVAFEDYSKEKPLQLKINWVPSVNAEQMRVYIDSICVAQPKQGVVRLLQQWAPRSLVEQLLLSVGIQTDTKLAEFGKKQRLAVIEAMTACTVDIVGRSAGSEFVTAGGVDTDEIDPSTMQSRITPGVFFGGEIMNVDGVTGGFNLQASWAAGRLAGESVVAYVQDIV